ncbi:hypothetical protein [uncultured Desulfovibrio sp.]|uniref:hypothetical protein n=1 Tax=uncultured Desulfovibrio sp. TaxID=167968 RepID=UPI0026274D79|nr:hypothetical protein [uncultured Desulfovibrio sp.]
MHIEDDAEQGFLRFPACQHVDVLRIFRQLDLFNMVVLTYDGIYPIKIQIKIRDTIDRSDVNSSILRQGSSCGGSPAVVPKQFAQTAVQPFDRRPCQIGEALQIDHQYRCFLLVGKLDADACFLKGGGEVLEDIFARKQALHSAGQRFRFRRKEDAAGQRVTGDTLAHGRTFP